MTHHSKLSLGKRPRRHDVRTLKLARYFTPALSAPPSRIDWTGGLSDWGMMLNDRLGCCTIAAVGHAVQTWRLNAWGAPGATASPTPRSPLAIPDSSILQYYESWDGYDPAQPASDQGGVELDVLNHWRQQGFSGHALEAFTAINLRAAEPAPGSAGDSQTDAQRGQSPTPSPQQRAPAVEVATAIWLFGGAYIGVELPVRAQDQDVWDVAANPELDDEPGSWGGHAVHLVGYEFEDPQFGVISSGLSAKTQAPRVGAPGATSPNPCAGSLTCITWGQPKKMTWAWFEKYCSEAYALISKDWIETSGLAPSGFDLEALENDLKMVVS